MPLHARQDLVPLSLSVYTYMLVTSMLGGGMYGIVSSSPEIWVDVPYGKGLPIGYVHVE